MCYGSNWADYLASHTSNVAGGIYGDSVECGDKARFLRANGYTGAAMDAGIPSDLKNNGSFFAHVGFRFFCIRNVG